MNLVLFYVWKDARTWAYCNHSFDMYPSYLGLVLCFFPILSPLMVHCWGWL